MPDLKCSFCLSGDEDRKYLTSDHNDACVCSNCAMMLTQYVLNKNPDDYESADKDNSLIAQSKKTEQFSDVLLALEDKWMEKDIINSCILDCGGTLNFVIFRFIDEGEDYYFECEIEVEDLDSLPADVEQKILNEIEWAFDEIRDDLESEGLDLDSYLGEKLLFKRVN